MPLIVTPYIEEDGSFVVSVHQGNRLEPIEKFQTWDELADFIEYLLEQGQRAFGKRIES